MGDKSENSLQRNVRIFPALSRQSSTESNGSEEQSIFSRFRMNRERRAASVDRPVIDTKSNPSKTKPKLGKMDRLRELTDRFRGAELPPLVPTRNTKKEERTRKLSAGCEQNRGSSPLPPRPASSEKKLRKPSVLFRTKSGDGRTSPAKEFFKRVSPLRLTSPNLARVVNLKPPTEKEQAKVSPKPPRPETKNQQREPPSDSIDDLSEKLTPKILVGSYQQRAIPFRSVSFSQYDNRDSKYPRLPKSTKTDPVLDVVKEEQKIDGAPSTINKLVAFFTDKKSQMPTEVVGHTSQNFLAVPVINEIIEKEINDNNSIISKLLRESPIAESLTQGEAKNVYPTEIIKFRGRKVEKQPNVQNSDSSLSDEGFVADGSRSTISEDLNKPERRMAVVLNLSDPTLSEVSSNSENCLTFPPRMVSHGEEPNSGDLNLGESFSDDAMTSSLPRLELGSSQETDDVSESTETTNQAHEPYNSYREIPQINASSSQIPQLIPQVNEPHRPEKHKTSEDTEIDCQARSRVIKSCSPFIAVNKSAVNPRAGSVPSGSNGSRKAPPTLLTIPSSPSHQRTCSSPSRLIGQPSNLLPEEANRSIKKFEEQRSATLGRTPSGRRHMDTRTHVVGELYDTERSYIESLNILVTKYINYLKNSEGCYLIDSGTVDEIFYQIPAILSYHENFLCELRRRLETWDATTCVGDVITNCLTQPPVVATYIAFVSHWQVAKETVRMACQTKPAFGKFLMKMKSEHKGKLELDSLLIMPVQRIPRYELLIKLLLKHTAKEHPDHDHLVRAQREVHELAVKINCMEKDYMAIEQQQAMLRELETLVEGLEPGHLASPLRTLIRHDTVTIPSSTLGIRKERTLFLCSDLLVIASVKKKAVMKRSAGFLSATGSISGLLEANKLKLLMRVHLNDIRVKAREDSIRRSGFKEYESFEEDLATLSKIAELSSNLHVGHSALDDIIKDISANVSRHLLEKQASDSQLSILELTVHAQDSAELFQVAFSNPEHRATWEEAFHQTKANLAEIAGSRSQPDFITALPIRKTRPGLQLRCATPTFQSSNKEVWLCNSDSYVGQICLLSLDPEPNVASCQTVCNSKITSILSVPGAHLSLSKDSDESAESMRHTSSDIVESCLALDSDSSSDGEDGDESIDDESMTSSRRETNLTFSSTPPTGSQNLSQGDDCSGQSEAFLSGPTMWAGTEDGSIYIYCSTENIRNRRLKKKLELRFCVTDLLYGSDKVFASLANGDLVVFIRDSGGAWSLNEPKVYPIGTSCTPPARLALAGANIWVSVGSSIVILSGENIVMEDRIPLSGDGQRLVSTFSVSSAGVWVALNGPPVVRLFDSKTFSSLLEINITPVVNKILLGCDDIIRQHKSACLRITTMYSCKDILWIGTSAGVIINVQLGESNSNPQITGLMEGHTGHVRFLTAVEVPLDFRIARFRRHSTRECSSPSTPSGVRYLVVSGGDGFEDFSGSRTAEVTGKDDSTNHVLLWKV